MDKENSTPREATGYFLNTAPEMDALERAAADGKHGRHYVNHEQMAARFHSIPGASHSVKLELSMAENIAGVTTGTLEQLTREQDADAALAFLYIAHILAPPNSLGRTASGRGIVDFDDVIAKIGWNPRSTVERREMHRRVYQFIQFGERAQVIGERRGKYKDKHTGEIINTVIRSSIWRIHRSEAPEQGSLFPLEEVPVSVQLVISPDWEMILTSPQTAQYLPMGETLGAIPGNKPSGAWARVIGLSLASFWRRLPREALDGSIKPTRRELVERYPPKTGTVDEILSSTQPNRALDYWCSALDILVEMGFLENSGETLVKIEAQKRRLPRQGWANDWLEEVVDLRPGTVFREALVGRIASLPLPVAPRRRGRPRKSP
jgi:hypothetical protein